MYVLKIEMIDLIFFLEISSGRYTTRIIRGKTFSIRRYLLQRNNPFINEAKPQFQACYYYSVAIDFVYNFAKKTNVNKQKQRHNSVKDHLPTRTIM